jgi:diaminopimelate epimerase
MQVRIPFTKMSGAGNDFVVIDNRSELLRCDKSALARALCSRHFGIGADGLLLVERSAAADFAMRYYNADGSYGGMCGNGGRCIARYVHDRDEWSAQLTFEALEYIYHAEVNDPSVILHMKPPKQLRTNILLQLHSDEFNVNFVDTGSPHAVIECSALEAVDVERIGREGRGHEKFLPEGANVNFVQVLGEGRLKMRTYERGVEAETLACGTGAVASAIVMSKLKGMRSPISVETRSGEELRVHFKKSGDEFSEVMLEGSAHFVFSGELLYDTDTSRVVDSFLTASVL